MALTAATVPEAKLRTMLSNSAAFRTWTSTANPTAALARIYVGHVDAPTLPFVLIGVKDYDFQRVAGGWQNVFAPSGSCLVMFTAAAGTGTTTAELLGFQATCVNILAEVWDLSGVSDNLSIVRTRLIAPPERSDPEDGNADGDYLQSIWQVSWDPR